VTEPTNHLYRSNGGIALLRNGYLMCRNCGNVWPPQMLNPDAAVDEPPFKSRPSWADQLWVCPQCRHNADEPEPTLWG
jgi:hypothetical protein